jgi:hypothetical protein
MDVPIDEVALRRREPGHTTSHPDHDGRTAFITGAASGI